MKTLWMAVAMTFVTVCQITTNCVACVAYAGDSPQFRGPNRDGKFDEQGLLKAWPDNGPPLAWVAKGLGKGYASASARITDRDTGVVNGKIYVPGMLEEDSGYAFVLNAADGTVERKIAYGKETLNKESKNEFR